jgi:hypothetical protein
MTDARQLWEFKRWVPKPGIFLREGTYRELSEGKISNVAARLRDLPYDLFKADNLVSLEITCEKSSNLFNFYGGESSAHGSIGFIACVKREEFEWLFLSDEINPIARIIESSSKHIVFLNNCNQKFGLYFGLGRVFEFRDLGY